MTQSMTAYATGRGQTEQLEWAWELRGVNAKGLDLRLRFPEGLETLDPRARKALSARLHRGSIALSLKVSRQSSTEPMGLNQAALAAFIAQALEVTSKLEASGLKAGPIDPAEVLARRGILDVEEQQDISVDDADAILASLEPLLDDFLEMRAREGAVLADVIEGQLAQMKGYIEASRHLVETHRGQKQDALKEALDRIIGTSETVDPDRLAQEAALLAIKGDVTEELDRLDAHVSAVADLLQSSGPVGRKLDFLMQEFNREANTLCSKSSSTELTQIGLDLKAAIEQMREQIQNVE